jgi:iron complex outermembrane receptor protein
MDISDLQLTVTAGSCSSRLIYNVPAVSQGLELEFAAAPTTNFDFAVSATLNNSEVRETVLSAGNVVGGIETGNRLPSVAKVQGAAAATYKWPMRAGSQGFVSATVNHVGDRYTLMEDVPLGDVATLDLTTWEAESGQTIGEPLTQTTFTYTPKMPAYTTANARVGLGRGNWETALYINNLTDTRAFLALDRERGTRARVGYLVNQPRTFGVSMTFNY